MKHKHVKSLGELKALPSPVDTNAAYRENLSRLDHIALWITVNVGSMKFFLLIFGWTIGWLAWNTLAPDELRFDPFPAFVLWLFISNMIQIFLMPLIMIGQNLQSNHAELRAQSDFEINIKAELEIETILKHLENQNELILKILTRIEQLEKQRPPETDTDHSPA